MAFCTQSSSSGAACIKAAVAFMSVKSTLHRSTAELATTVATSARRRLASPKVPGSACSMASSNACFKFPITMASDGSDKPVAPRCCSTNRRAQSVLVEMRVGGSRVSGSNTTACRSSTTHTRAYKSTAAASAAALCAPMASVAVLSEAEAAPVATEEEAEEPADVAAAKPLLPQWKRGLRPPNGGRRGGAARSGGGFGGAGALG
jgi:hypothetical protein